MPSSVIAEMRYEPGRRVLEIVFRGGRGTYLYSGVPMEEWVAFVSSKFKGSYLNEVFKAKGYEHKRLRAGEDRKVGGDVLRWPRTAEDVGAEER